ncbi:MAG TPA: bifunctional adenosylcobinamide kinase/adenosylcobinamide-phosphate guanylyltransferase [Bacillota bacterium]
MGSIILVTGGARSGKSRYAEQLASNIGKRVLYLATAIGFDDEMQDRIARHQQRRPPEWETWEGYHNLKAVFADPAKTYDAILLDCVTLLVSNRLLETEAAEAPGDAATLERLEQAIIADLGAFLDAVEQRQTTLIMVTNEVGWGIVPENRLARIFRDLAGRVNQYLATRAHRVYLLVCGQVLPVK